MRFPNSALTAKAQDDFARMLSVKLFGALTDVHTRLRHEEGTYADRTRSGVLPGGSNDCDSSTCCHTIGTCERQRMGLSEKRSFRLSMSQICHNNSSNREVEACETLHLVSAIIWLSMATQKDLRTHKRLSCNQLQQY